MPEPDAVRRLRALAARGRGRLARSTVADRIGSTAASVARAIPMPDALRRRLGVLRLRPGRRIVPLDHLLLGGQSGRSAQQFAADASDLLWGSTPIADGPHAALFRDPGLGDASPEDVLASPYGEHALRILRLYGSYFEATDEHEVVELIRRTVTGRTDESGAGRSRPDRPADLLPRVRKIRASDRYEIVDGHHRLGRMAAQGASRATVRVEWRRSETPLQSHLNRMSWLAGKRELYQPVDAPELSPTEWSLVRRCDDRSAKVRAHIDEIGLGPGATALDVASAYGWFVSRYRDWGLDAEGVERDPLAVPLGCAVYGLPPGAITTADAIEFMQGCGRRWDIVSCFSLVHHFALGLGEVSAGDVLRLLDGITGRVLYLDTGQAHERWFVGRLDDWTDEGVVRQIQEHTTFSTIRPLGRDHDGVGPYVGNYGRMLFACTRDATAG